VRSPERETESHELERRSSLKWRAPRAGDSLIERPRLLRRLHDAASRRLIVVHAPAGFGKTTMVAQWVERQGDAVVGWLTLEERDSEILQFLREVVLCVAAAGLSMDQLESLAEQEFMEMQPRSVVSALCVRIAADPRKLILVLEDFHRCSSAEVLRFTNELIQTAPANLQVVITSRQLPAMNLPQLIAARGAVEIGAEELRFSLEETSALTRRECPADRLQELFDTTEGWPIAVQLARLLFRDNEAGAVVDRFCGHSGHIAAYLIDQIFAAQDPDMQEFLLHTSVLERFSAPLANAVCERSDCWDLLRRADCLQTLLVPLDEHKEWFRYHHLFGECVRDLLRRKHGNRMAAINLRASQWYESEGYLLEAVTHARHAGSLDRSAALIEKAGGWQLMLYKGIGYVANLLKQIPEQKLSEYPGLMLARAYLSVKQGRMAEARATYDLAFAQHEHKSRSKTLDRAFLNVGTILAMFDDAPLESIAQYRDMVANELRIEADDDLTWALIDIKKAIGSLANGEFDDADRSVKAAMSAMRRANSIVGLSYCYIQAGVAALYQGQLRLATANFDEARRLARENFGADSTVGNYAEVLAGVTLFYGGQLDAAAQAAFFEALGFVSGNDGSFDIYASGFEVAVDLALLEGRFDAAASAVEQLRKLAQSFGNVRLRHFATALDLLVSTSGGDHDKVPKLVIDAQNALGRRNGEASTWRVYNALTRALASHHGAVDRTKAIALLDRAVTACRANNAPLYLIQALMNRAYLLDLAGQRTLALNDCFEALRLAAAEHIVQPFLRRPALLPLLRAAQKMARADGSDVLSATLLTECVEFLSAHPWAQVSKDSNQLSPREMEVMAELARGASNKEIARSLDVTENTVKFHLKNIFQKINAQTRTQAIALIREHQASTH
jgi:LuxR family transcriptional regulator, maltose regulon positive regulatory protein